MEAKSGAVLDHEEAEAERAQAERDAEDEALAAAAIEETPDQGTPDDDPDAEPADEPQEPGADTAGLEPGGEPVGDVVLELDGQLSFGVGGKKPTGATLRLTGGKVEIAVGQLSKGESIAVRVEAVVDDVGFKDQTDSKTGQIIGCERRHKARITNVELLSE